jgi:Domain of unknown function (DUF6475)
MKASDRTEFSGLISDVMGYYRQDVSGFVVGLWWNACQPFDLEQVRKALTAHAMDAERGVFAPKVADIIRVLAGTVTDRAALAWGKTLGALSSVGAYSDVIFDDAAIHAAVEDCGGWSKMCRSSMEELGYLQHRFCASYKAYVGRGTFPYQRKLNGDRSPDEMYARRGIAPPKAILVGDPQKALLVYDKGLESREFTPMTMNPVFKVLGRAVPVQAAVA